MDNPVIRQHGDDTAAASHVAAQPAVTNNAQSLVADGNVSVPPALRPLLAVANVQLRRHADALGLAQRRHDSRLADHAVGRPYAPTKV